MKEVYELDIYQLAEQLSVLYGMILTSGILKLKIQLAIRLFVLRTVFLLILQKGSDVIRQQIEKDFIYIQEVPLKKLKHGCENSLGEIFLLRMIVLNIKK